MNSRPELTESYQLGLGRRLRERMRETPALPKEAGWKEFGQTLRTHLGEPLLKKLFPNHLRAFPQAMGGLAATGQSIFHEPSVTKWYPGMAGGIGLTGMLGLDKWQDHQRAKNLTNMPLLQRLGLAAQSVVNPDAVGDQLYNHY